MKKNITHAAKDWFSRLMLLAVFLVAGAATKAVAADPVYVDIVLGEPVPQATFAKTYAKLVAPKTGVLSVVGTSPSVLRPYSDEACTQQIAHNGNYLPEGGWGYEIQVTEGVTYYFYNFSMNSNDVTTFTMDGEEGFTASITPEPGSVFSLAGEGMFSVQFNKSVLCRGALVQMGTANLRREVGVNGNIISLSLGTLINDFLKAGRLQPGDPITITLQDVRSAADESVKYGENGTLKVEYSAPAAQVAMEGEPVLPEKMLSYFTESNPDGQIVLTFDGELLADNDIATATLEYGELNPLVSMDKYVENLPMTISGNTVTVDLRGKLRTPANMLPAATVTYDKVTVKIGGLKAANGDYVYSPGQGTVGSFSYDLPYEEIKANIVSEFTPAAGASLQGVSSIELWLRGEEYITYSGVKFSYVDGTEEKSVVVPMDQITKVSEEGETTLTIPVPADVAGKTNITVTLADAEYADGVEHNISARYDAFIVTVLSPRENTLAQLTDGDIIKVSVSDETVQCLVYQIRDLNPTDPDQAIVKTMAYMQKSETDGTFSAEIPMDIILLQGHTYNIEFTAAATEMDYNYDRYVGKDTHVLYGTTLPYEYSDINFVSLTPDPASTTLTSVDDNTFVVTFDGLVNMNAETTFINTGQGTRAEFESIVPTDPQVGEDGVTEYSSTWTLTVNKSFMATLLNAIDISFVATDLQGRRVKGTDGTDDNTFFYYSYTSTLGIPEPVITPASGETVESLYTFMVDNEGGSDYKGINLSYAKRVDSAVLYDAATREEVAHVVSAEPYIPEEEQDNWDYNPTRVILTLDHEVTDAGRYYLQIPEQYFIYGSQMTTVMSNIIMANYTIEGKGDSQATLELTSSDPEDGSTVASLSSIRIDFPVNVFVNYSFSGKPVTVRNKETGDVVTTGTIDYDPSVWDDLPYLFINLDQKITEEGLYEVEVAEAALGDASYDTSMGQSGSCNKAFTLTYGIGRTTGIAGAVAEAGSYKVYNLSGVLVLTTTDKAELGSLPAGLYIVNGKKTYLR